MNDNDKHQKLVESLNAEIDALKTYKSETTIRMAVLERENELWQQRLAVVYKELKKWKDSHLQLDTMLAWACSFMTEEQQAKAKQALADLRAGKGTQ